ncbi:MAG: site-specific integrase [Alphaproteobacteria bacterium]|nr:site-specific integrase [Alphaproteobacteria bacterium]
MAKITLTASRMEALKPRKATYDIRDTRLRGFGVRVLPTGRKQFFVQCQYRGERVWKIVGDAMTMDISEARAAAAEMLVAIRRGEEAPAAPDETLFEAVAETAFRRHERLWKRGTLIVNRSYLRNQLLPHFAGRPVADIDRQEIRHWFTRLWATPVAADRSMPILSVIMKEAERMGLRPEGSNPCRGIKRYRRKGRERFLSDDELRRLSKQLAAHEVRWPGQVAVIRLLLLTGCRKSEILTLQWSDYRAGNLFLRDSKTGPRTVWLSGPARRVLDGIGRNGRWVFPVLRGDRARSITWLEQFWTRVRAEAELGDVHLHDLRHSVASLALRRGETVLAIGKLLGHRRPETTLKYVHFADAMLHDAAETVGAALDGS